MNVITHPYETSRATPSVSRIKMRYLNQSNTLSVTGRSTGIAVLPAYNRLIETANNHLKNANKLNCYFHYTVINASTTKLLFNLFAALQKQLAKGKNINIHWVVNKGDEDIIDTGLDFKNAFKLNFHISVR